MTDSIPGSARHSLQGRHLPEELLSWLSRTTDQRRAWRHVRHDPGLRSDPGSPTNPHVPGHRRLPADLDEVLEHGRTRDAHLRHNDTTSAEADVVPDLDQVIEPGTRSDHRIACRTSINRGVGTNLDVVLQDDAP